MVSAVYHVPSGMMATIRRPDGPSVVLDWLSEGRLDPKARELLELQGRPVLLASEGADPCICGLWTHGWSGLLVFDAQLEQRLRRDIVGRVVCGNDGLREAVSDWATVLERSGGPVLRATAQMLHTALPGLREVSIAVPQRDRLTGDPDVRLVVVTSAAPLPMSRARLYGPGIGSGGRQRVLWSVERWSFDPDEFAVQVRLALIDAARDL